MIQKQIHANDCGIIVLQRLFENLYCKKISLSYLKNNTNYDLSGINILELTKISKKIGFNLTPLEGKINSLKNLKIKNQCIAMIKNESVFHYVLIEKLTNKFIYYFDPILGKRKIDWNQANQKFLDILIWAEKSFEFDKSIFDYKTNWFDNSFLKEKILSIICLISITTVVLILSFYLKIVLDQISISHSFSKLLSISLIFIFLMILKFIIFSINEILVEKIEIKFQIQILDLYIAKVKNIEFIQILNYGEVEHLKNLEIGFKIANIKSKFLINFVVNIFSLLFSSSILIWLEFKIFIILLTLTLILTSWSFVWKNKFNDLEIENINHSTKVKKCFLNYVNCSSQNRFNSNKTKSTNELFQSLNNLLKTQINHSYLSNLYSLVLSIVKSLIPYLIVLISLPNVWKNEISIGQIMLFLSMTNFFVSPLNDLLSLVVEIPIVKNYVDTLNAFLLASEEKNQASQIEISKINNIKIFNLSFNFLNSNQLLKINELEINNSLHIVGTNGCGKSTLFKIISTLIYRSEIMFNDKSIDYLNLNSLRKNICFISSNDYLPYGNVYDFLSLSIDNNSKYFIDCFEKYNLYDFFNQTNLTFQTLIDENGKNLSSGQKQLILIMKLFTNDYSLILLDEVFENIDQDIMKKLKPILQDYLKNKIVLEISHQKNYLFNSKEINCEQYNS